MEIQAFRARLMEHYDYNPISGLITFRNGKRKGRIAGSVNKSTGYTMISFEGKYHYAHRVAWLVTYGEFPPNTIDHVDNCRTNNKLSNLRLATSSENNRNRLMQSNNSSGYVGVSFRGNRNKWQAYVCIDKEQHHVGLFQSAEEAARARDKVAFELHGEFAKLNFEYSCINGKLQLLIGNGGGAEEPKN